MKTNLSFDAADDNEATKEIGYLEPGPTQPDIFTTTTQLMMLMIIRTVKSTDYSSKR